MKGGKAHYEFQEITHHCDCKLLDTICTEMHLQVWQSYSLQCTDLHTQRLTRLGDRETPYTRATSAKIELTEKEVCFLAFPSSGSSNISVSGYIIHWCTFQTSCSTHSETLGSYGFVVVFVLITHKFTRCGLAANMLCLFCYSNDVCT